MIIKICKKCRKKYFRLKEWEIETERDKNKCLRCIIREELDIIYKRK
jgi:hypothetical protein